MTSTTTNFHLIKAAWPSGFAASCRLAALVAAVTALGLGACTPSQIQVNRTALVPAPQPMLFSPSDAIVEVTGSMRSIMGTPTLGDESAGLQAATQVMAGSIEWLGRYVATRHECMVAPSSGSKKLFPHQPHVEQSATACGPMISFRSKEKDGWRWHVGMGLAIWEVPIVEFERWDNELYVAHGQEQFYNTRGLWSFGIGPTYRSGKLTGRGSATMTSQFYVERYSNYVGYYEHDGEEISKRGAMVLSVGAGYDLAKNVRVGIDLSAEMLGDPVHWGPQALFQLAVGLGTHDREPASTAGATATPVGAPTWGAPGLTPPGR
ncbi:MAG: hypothetical protein IPL79_13020 [Myxococcales bacterium]|nr:hypothetical protein [Myxococcales bacterium]